MKQTKLSKNGKPLGRPKKTAEDQAKNTVPLADVFLKIADWAKLEKPKIKKIEFENFPQVMDHRTGNLIAAKDIIERYRSGAIRSAAEYRAKSASDDGKKLALDNVVPPMYGNPIGVNLQQINAALIDNVFLGYAEYSLLSQNSIMSTLINGFAEEMMRKWIKFYSASGKKNVEDKIKQIEAEFERLKVRDKLEWAAKVAMFQGGCLINYKIKNDEKNNELQKPLNLNKAKLNKGDLEYISVIEPTWYVPIHFNTWDPRSEMFYEVDMYSIFGVSCHYSRVTKMIYRKVPNLIKPTYNFNGIPLAQLLVPHIERFENALTEVINIISRLNLSVLSTSLEAILALDSSKMANDAILANRVKMFNLLRNNLGLLVLDKTTEDFKQVEMSLANLDVLLSQFLELCAMIAQIPVAKAFGQSPRGLNATGEYDQDNYYDTLMSHKNSMFRESLNTIMQLVQINLWGKEDPDLCWEFEKLEETNRLEDSQITLNNANAAGIMIDKGVISPQEEQKRLAADKDGMWNEIEIEEKDITHEGEYEDDDEEEKEE